jgi:hypothetical protein
VKISAQSVSDPTVTVLTVSTPYIQTAIEAATMAAFMQSKRTGDAVQLTMHYGQLDPVTNRWDMLEEVFGVVAACDYVDVRDAVTLMTDFLFELYERKCAAFSHNFITAID